MNKEITLKELLSRWEPEQVMREGGEWLGEVRRYLQRHVRGGETCIWGSGQPLTLSVLQIEEIAAYAVWKDRQREKK